MGPDDLVFTRSLYEGEYRYDLRKWIVKKEFDRDVDKFITLVFPTKAGQSIRPPQLAKFLEQLDDITKAVQEAKKDKHYEARFSLGGGLMFTVSSKPYYKAQFRRWYLPKLVYKNRIDTRNIDGYQDDLRPSHDGAVFSLWSFDKFRQIAQEAIEKYGNEKCQCEDSSICSFCSPFTWEIQIAKNRYPYE